MIATLGGMFIVTVGLLLVVWALGWTDKPVLMLATYLAGMGSVIAILIGYSKAVK